LLLQAHGRMSCRDLAERLEVSQRTMHRDMEALSAAAEGNHLLVDDGTVTITHIESC
jgi:DeoR/GlpR family transcriptional regulator of sugar metabolism